MSFSSLDNPQDWLVFKRHVRFGDTDGAGVIHFHNLFRWAHEAWEESLESFGLLAINIFPGNINSDDDPEVALPIANCRGDFVRPIRTGDILDVEIEPQRIDSQSFQVLIRFKRADDVLASTLIRHIAINIQTRKRCLLPKDIQRWLEASSIGGPIQPL